MTKKEYFEALRNNDVELVRKACRMRSINWKGGVYFAREDIEKRSDGDSVLDVVRKSGNLDVLQCLFFCLIEDVACGYRYADIALETAREITSHEKFSGLDMHDGMTPLAYALRCRSGNGSYDDFLKELVDYFADIDANMVVDEDGSTLLMYVSHVRVLTESVELLLKSGARPNAVNIDGSSALMFAVASGNADAVDMLLAAGADAHAEDKNGVTPILLAFTISPNEWKYREADMLCIARALLDAGCADEIRLTRKKGTMAVESPASSSSWNYSSRKSMNLPYAKYPACYVASRSYSSYKNPDVPTISPWPDVFPSRGYFLENISKYMLRKENITDDRLWRWFSFQTVSSKIEREARVGTGKHLKRELAENHFIETLVTSSNLRVLLERIDDMVDDGREVVEMMLFEYCSPVEILMCAYDGEKFDEEHPGYRMTRRHLEKALAQGAARNIFSELTKASVERYEERHAHGDKTSESEGTALMRAAVVSPESYVFLRSRGADELVRMENGLTARSIAARFHPEVLRTRNGRAGEMNINARDGRGLSALMHAADSNRTDAAVELVMSGAFVDEVSYQKIREHLGDYAFVCFPKHLSEKYIGKKTEKRNTFDEKQFRAQYEKFLDETLHAVMRKFAAATRGDEYARYADAREYLTDIEKLFLARNLFALADGDAEKFRTGETNLDTYIESFIDDDDMLNPFRVAIQDALFVLRRDASEIREMERAYLDAREEKKREEEERRAAMEEEFFSPDGRVFEVLTLKQAEIVAKLVVHGLLEGNTRARDAVERFFEDKETHCGLDELTDEKRTRAQMSAKNLFLEAEASGGNGKDLRTLIAEFVAEKERYEEEMENCEVVL